MDSLYLVMPAYNEEANIEEVVRAWYPVLEGKDEASRMVIADSGSSDRTHEILVALQLEFPKLEILSDTGKQHGPKVIALYNYAIQNGADYIFQTDSDGQTDPAEFARFWNLRGRYAGIFGFRHERGDGKIRAFVERVVCLLLGLYFHVSVPDANAPFRLMRSDVVAKYMPRMKPDYNLPNIMLTTFFAYYNEKIRFRKITFRPRQAGVNSVNVPKIVKIGWKALWDFRAFKRDMQREEARLKAEKTYPELSEDIFDEPFAPEPKAVKPDAQAFAPESVSVMPEAESVTQAFAPESVSVMPEAETVTEAEAVTETETVTAESATPDASETEADAVTETVTPDAETETPEIVSDAEAVTEETPEIVSDAEAVTEETPEVAPDAEAETPEVAPDAEAETVTETETVTEEAATPDAEASDAKTVSLEKPDAKEG